MFELIPALLVHIKQFLTTASLCWNDARVPLLARVFVLIAPLYWLNPFDLISDLNPGGQCDDMVIVSVLVVMALRLVPEGVFRDSRRAALLGKKAAVFGLLYVTTSANLQCHEYRSQSANARPACFSRAPAPLSGPLLSPVNEHSAQLQAQATDQHRQGFSPPNLYEYCWNHYVPGYYTLKHLLSAASLRGRDLMASHGPPVGLTTRAGQKQLYSTARPSVDFLAFEPTYSLAMPPRSAGGFFVAQVPEIEGLWLPKS